jgi:hypothetical protein
VHFSLFRRATPATPSTDFSNLNLLSVKFRTTWVAPKKTRAHHTSHKPNQECRLNKQPYHINSHVKEQQTRSGLGS